MKKQLTLAMARQKYLIIGGAILAVVIIAGVFLFWFRPVERAKTDIANFQAYQPQAAELAKVKRNEKGYLYYYAADGKRYVFPDKLVFQSWFGNYDPEKLAFEDVKTMSESPLGGNVFLRPGSLLQSPTLLDTFIVVKNGLIRPVADAELLSKFYGTSWQNQVIRLPDYYFSEYTMGKPIKSADDFPVISKTITIDQDKGLIKNNQ